jgi:hypothetical protein
VGGGVQGGSTRHVGHWMAYCTCPGWLLWWWIWWNDDWQGKPKYSEKTCPSATLSTTNLTWPDPGSSPARRGGKPAANRLSYGAAIYRVNGLKGKGKTANIVSYLLPPLFFICFSNSGEIFTQSKYCHVICDISYQSSCAMRERSFTSTDIWYAEMFN